MIESFLADFWWLIPLVVVCIIYGFQWEKLTREPFDWPPR